MTPAIALLTIGLILLRAGWKNESVVDVVLGRKTRKATGNIQDIGGGDFSLSGNLSSPAGVEAHPGTTVIDGQPVARWIAPWVKMARRNGWHGRVTSGYRSTAEQSYLFAHRSSNSNPVAEPGKSNHQYTTFPRGAVDVSDPDGFRRALPPGAPLRQGTVINDPVHFSFTGH